MLADSAVLTTLPQAPLWATGENLWAGLTSGVGTRVTRFCRDFVHRTGTYNFSRSGIQMGGFSRMSTALLLLRTINLQALYTGVGV